MRTLAMILRVFAYVWVSAAMLLFLVGTVAYIYFAESRWEAWQKVQAEMSPFATVDWLVKMVILSPGIGALVLSDYLKKRGKR